LRSETASKAASCFAFALQDLPAPSIQVTVTNPDSVIVSPAARITVVIKVSPAARIIGIAPWSTPVPTTITCIVTVNELFALLVPEEVSIASAAATLSGASYGKREYKHHCQTGSG
jgi:hypothetical protein